MNKTILAIALILSMNSATAQEGWYVGLGYGGSVLNPEEVNLTLETPQDYLDSSTEAFNLRAGYQTTNCIGVEARYDDLGSYTEENLDIPYNSYGIYGTCRLKGDNLEIKGKLGYSVLKADENKSGTYTVDQLNDGQFSGGVEVSYYMTPEWSVGVEAMYYDKDAQAAFITTNFFFGEDEVYVGPVVVEEPEYVKVAETKVVGANFLYDDYTLLPVARHEVKEFFDFTFDEYGLDNIKRIEYHGFASSEGSEQYNQQLSENRAISVARYVETLYSGSILVADIQGFGEAFPIVYPDVTEAQRAVNRRVEIKVYVEKEVVK